MASLVERLRVRSDRRPLYNIDESDDEFDVVRKKSRSDSSSHARIQRPDVREGSCQACGTDENLLSCETCTYSYHPNCLLPQLRGPVPSSWKCPECLGPLSEIEKILDCEVRTVHAIDSDASKEGSNLVTAKHYLVKWKGLSYLHCTWVPEMEFIKAYKTNTRLKTKVNNFHKQASSTNDLEEENEPIRPDWTTVDRIIACREAEEEKEYLVKWRELSYDECYWELESNISSFHKEIERFNRIESRSGKKSVAKQRSNLLDVSESKKQKEFQQYDSNPGFLSGGSLHPYQLEGLNFLRFSWSKHTHVILADEMGLGKTIQSIAFLASLFEENVAPHLVVAPLSTLRNWEREFATWAPHMNVVMYVGGAQARSVIREYEFYYPRSQKKSKKKKPGHAGSESKQERIKFDVLLTSYEMINLDSTSLKPIKWECMIVDEGHRLKNKDSKLFYSLTQYSSKHRVLLTGTPLQNNMDELFMLMHFLDPVKFGRLDEFQEEFRDINQEEQVSRLHKMLAPHLLRRVKKDVMKDLPPKKELILRVELSIKQKEYYKAILTRNYQILTRKGGPQISLINVVMELRKLCCHPFMLEGVEPEDVNEFNKQLLETSGKLHLLDKMMVKLREQGHRVLIYTQFQHMLDLLEDYCNHRKWHYERIDGKVSGAERQIRIDRFNAKTSSRFCFLLSTRAGGLGINLATADTVIIYDSDWNPHADLQAMARAHRLGQRNKVMIYRLVTRGTIEERMMEMTKKKMILEHLVVGKLKTQNINQEELDDIIRYGSKELFADDTDELVKSRQIHYDDTAIDRLLNREHVGDEDASLDVEEEDGFLKAFKVANFEYVDEAEAIAEEETLETPAANKASASNYERASYWEDLLGDKYDMQKIEEFNSMGKGKRSRKQMVSVEEDDLAGLEDLSSGEEDDNYEAESSDNETASTEATTVRKPYRKRPRCKVTSDSVPLMEGEGRSLRVMGFNQSQRGLFIQILMRFGAGNYDWADFAPRLKQKTVEEIHNYGSVFLAHISEDVTDSPTFSDGVPKEGLRIPEVLVRISTLTLIRDKVRASSEKGAIIFPADILSRFPGLRGGKVWKEQHDHILLQALLKHGYGRWQAIVDDKDLEIQEVICQELNLINIPVPGASQAQNSAPRASQAQFNFSEMSHDEESTSGVSPADRPVPAFCQTQNGVNSGRVETHGNQANRTGDGKDTATNVVGGATDTAVPPQHLQGQSVMHHFREMQRRQVEFIKKRVLLLERGLQEELLAKCYVKGNTSVKPNVETGRNAAGIKLPTSEVSDAQIIDQLPQANSISPEEISAFANDKDLERLTMARLYNEMSRVVVENAQHAVEAYLSRKTTNLKLGRNLAALKAFNLEINQILSPVQRQGTTTSRDEYKERVENLSSLSGVGTDTDTQLSAIKSTHERETNNISGSNGTGGKNEEEQVDGASDKSPGVIFLD